MLIALRRLDQIAKHRAAAESSNGGPMPAGVARGGVAAGEPPVAAASPEPMRQRPPIGQTGSGPLWSIEPGDGRNVDLVGLGLRVTLCPSSQAAIHSALAPVVAAAAAGGVAIAEGDGSWPYQQEGA